MILTHTIRNNAFIPICRLLRLQSPTVCSHAALGIIHGLLQRVVFPPKHVVAVLSVSRVVTHAEDKWLRAVGGPIGFVVEFTRVPDDLDTFVRRFIAWK